MTRTSSPAERRSGWQALAGSVTVPAVLAGVLAVAIVLYGVSHVVRHQVTDDLFYLQALEEQRVYDRFYQQILADPTLAEAVDPLLGNVPSARPLLVSVLRLILPPDAIRGYAETAAHEWERYLRGETDAWRPQIDLRGVDQSIVSFINAYVAGLVATTPEENVQSVGEFRRETNDRLTGLREGRLPDNVPSLQVTTPTEANALAVLMLAGAPGPVSPGTREQIAAALLVGDAREALALAVPSYLSPRLREAAGLWREHLESGYRLDLVRSFEVLAEQPPGTISQSLADARSVGQALGRPLAIGSSVAALASLAGLLWILARQRRSSLRWVGGSLVGAAVLGTLTLIAALMAFDAATDRALSGLPDDFSPSLEIVFEDVASQLAASIRSTAIPALIMLVVLGGILLAWRWGLRRAHASVRLLRRRGWRVATVIGAVAAALLLVAFAELRTATSDPELMRCNGHYQLCDRRVDEVVFAGTHNSMASAARGWIFPHHDPAISAQLEAGYRALLLDTHYWESKHPFLPFRDELTEEHQQALLDLLLEVDPPRPGSFLCHAACGLGAVPLEQALANINRFLRAQPNEVVILSIEDYITPEDTRAAFEASGLLSLVYRPDGDDEWPTLRELIERDERVIVFADNEGGTFDWYLPFGTYVQDTPFNFRAASDFSCRPNRGHRNASMLMINHWISSFPPDRARAAMVNRQRVLLERVEECREERDMAPNIIAVDFFAIGDTLLVVDELNSRPS
ncbi:MAG: hypothetical protein GEU80_15550 [Dehalococcoidia bacterium]|nr:hypothetical protein [Dehalococcoidia bacterium]